MMTSDLDALLGRGGESEPGQVVPPARRSDLAARLGRKSALDRAATWPGGTLAIRVRVLTAEERQQANAAARKAVPDGVAVEATPVDRARFQLECVLQILARAVLDGGGAALFSAAELDSVCTEDEISALYELYADVRRSVDPAGVAEETIAELAAAATAGDRTAFLEAANTLPRAALFSLLERIVSNLPVAPQDAPPPEGEGD